MITSIAAAIAQNVIRGWLWRRVQELAPSAGVFVPIYRSIRLPCRKRFAPSSRVRAGA